MNPFISIITPTYNRAYILPTAIQSVLAQTYPDWEMIIVDDGSTDNTDEVVRSYNDPRIRYVHQKNQGPAAARNRGMEEARGQWFAYLDSDNTFLPAYIERMRQHLSSETIFAFPKGYRFLELYERGTLVVRIDKTEDEFPDAVSPQDIFHRKLHTDTNGILHHRSVFEDGIRFDSQLSGMEDWDFLLTLCEQYPDGFLYLPEVLYTYHQRYGGDGLVSSGDYRFQTKVFEEIYRKHEHAPLMKGQSWYPERIEKWNRLAERYERGEIPPYYLYYFKDHWPAKYRHESD